MVGLIKRSGGWVVQREGRQQLWWTAKRAMSAFTDDEGRVLREEERSRENVYMKQREAELLEKLRKQAEKLEEIKRALAEYKEAHSSLQNWVREFIKSEKQQQS